jgi:hypothetical protein
MSLAASAFGEVILEIAHARLQQRSAALIENCIGRHLGATPSEVEAVELASVRLELRPLGKPLDLRQKRPLPRKLDDPSGTGPEQRRKLPGRGRSKATGADAAEGLEKEIHVLGAAKGFMWRNHRTSLFREHGGGRRRYDGKRPEPRQLAADALIEIFGNQRIGTVADCLEGQSDQ